MDSRLTVRPLEPADAEAVDRVLLAAFGEDGAKVAALTAALRPGHALAEVLAEIDGEVVGHVMLSRGWIDAREALVDVAVLSPLSVVPAHQRTGIGSRLIGAAFAAADEQGLPAIFLEGDPGYYAHQGFAAAEPLGFGRPSPRIPEPAFQVALLDAHEEWMMGPLVYGEPFWTHDCVGLRDPLLARRG